MLQANGIENTKEKEDQIDKALDFHNEIANMLAGSTDNTKNIRTISQLQKLCPDVDWLELGNIIFENNKLEPDETIQVQDENFICELRKVIKGKEEIFANHVFINVVDILSAGFNEYKEIGSLSLAERQSSCVATTKKL